MIDLWFMALLYDTKIAAGALVALFIADRLRPRRDRVPRARVVRR